MLIARTTARKRVGFWPLLITRISSSGQCWFRQKTAIPRLDPRSGAATGCGSISVLAPGEDDKNIVGAGDKSVRGADDKVLEMLVTNGLEAQGLQTRWGCGFNPPLPLPWKGFEKLPLSGLLSFFLPILSLFSPPAFEMGREEICGMERDQMACRRRLFGATDTHGFIPKLIHAKAQTPTTVE